jgi:hypothetical protein
MSRHPYPDFFYFIYPSGRIHSCDTEAEFHRCIAEGAAALSSDDARISEPNRLIVHHSDQPVRVMEDVDPHFSLGRHHD